jgi:hypothetical protein
MKWHRWRLHEWNCYFIWRVRDLIPKTGGQYRFKDSFFSIVKRSQVLYEEVGRNEQCGFRCGGWCADGIFYVMMAPQKRKGHGLDSFVLFIDLIKAFDSISREALFEILRRYGMPDHFVNIIILLRLYSEAKIKIALGDQDIVVDQPQWEWDKDQMKGQYCSSSTCSQW